MTDLAATFTRLLLGLWQLLRAILETLALAVVFFGILTPFALIRRLVRPDPLHLAPDPLAHSYWTARDDGNAPDS